MSFVYQTTGLSHCFFCLSDYKSVTLLLFTNKCLMVFVYMTTVVPHGVCLPDNKGATRLPSTWRMAYVYLTTRVSLMPSIYLTTRVPDKKSATLLPFTWLQECHIAHLYLTICLPHGFCLPDYMSVTYLLFTWQRECHTASVSFRQKVSDQFELRIKTLCKQ